MSTNLTAKWICQEISENYTKEAYANVKLKSGQCSFSIDKILFCALSPLFCQIQMENPDLEMEVHLPDFEPKTLENLCHFLHFGTIELTKEEKEGLKILLKSLQIPANISEELPVIIPQKLPILKELTYHCTVEGCASHFFTHVALKNHVENVHKEYAFVCHLCQNRYRYQSTLREHLQTHQDFKGYLCDICGRAFRTKDLCSNHRLSHGDRKLTCSECGAKFKQRHVLHQHKMIKHKKSKKFACETCGKTFCTKQNRDTHLRIHSGESPYSCEICKANFKRIHHFKKHLTTLSHIDKVAQLKTKGERISSHLDPVNILGDDAHELVKQTTCEICPKSANQPVTKFKSSYHFCKHIKSRAHMEKILQLSESGQTIPAHLLPPDLVVESDLNSDVFILETV